MPRLLSLKSDEEKAEYLSRLFRETYIKDIEDRYNLRGEETLIGLTNILASSIGSLTSPNKLSRTASSSFGRNISDKTIRNYIEYLKDAFLISETQHYNIKGKYYFSSLFKYYYSDLGLRNVQLNFRQFEITHLLENLIYNELIYRGYNVDVGVINMETDGIKKNVGIDFVCNLGDKRYYIQSAYLLETKDKEKQEMRPLINTGDFFKKIIIVREDIKPYQNELGILIMGIKYFLLDENSIL